MDLSVVIVSWNVWPLLHRCLTSLESGSRPDTPRQRLFGPPERSHSMEVIVVDNASHDGTPDHLSQTFPWVKLTVSSNNLGFTAGNNLGYAQSSGRFIYFLNPDTELDQERSGGDCLGQVFEAIQRDSSMGLVGPQLRYADGGVQNSRRRFPQPLTGFFESTWLGRAWPGNPWASRLHMLDWQVDYAHDVDWVVGAAMLARREALEAVRMAAYAGPFDESFFMYSEELDLCRRLKEAGWRIGYVPRAVVIHYEGRSSEQAVAARHIHFNTSKVRYYQKYFGDGWAAGLRQFLLAEYRLQLVQEWLKWLVGQRRDLRRARMDAYRAVIAHGLNPRNV